MGREKGMNVFFRWFRVIEWVVVFYKIIIWVVGFAFLILGNIIVRFFELWFLVLGSNGGGGYKVWFSFFVYFSWGWCLERKYFVSLFIYRGIFNFILYLRSDLFFWSLVKKFSIYILKGVMWLFRCFEISKEDEFWEG